MNSIQKDQKPAKPNLTLAGDRSKYNWIRLKQGKREEHVPEKQH